MQKSLFNGLAGLALLVALGSGCASSKPYVETPEDTGWHLFIHAKKDNPRDQYAYARFLEERGLIKTAGAQYKALTVYWPQAPEAADAQYRFARILEQRGRLFKAFDEYQYLIEHYTTGYDFDAVLERQFNIAQHLMDTPKGRFLFFPGFKAPERAVPLFEKIVSSAPEWSRTPEAQYLIGRAYELNRDFELAVVAYMAAEYRYPNSAFAEAAAFGRLYALYELAVASPYDEQMLEDAWASVVVFQQRFPQSDRNPIIAEYKKTLYRMRAENAYTRARYYDRIAKKPQAAVIEYRNLLALFPQSEWASIAESRIAELQPYAERKP